MRLKEERAQRRTAQREFAELREKYSALLARCDSYEQQLAEASEETGELSC